MPTSTSFTESYRRFSVVHQSLLRTHKSVSFTDFCLSQRSWRGYVFWFCVCACLCVYLSADLLNIRIRINPEIRFRIFDHFWSRQPKCKSHVQFAWGCNFFFMFSVFCQKQLNSLVHYPQINHNSQNSLTVI